MKVKTMIGFLEQMNPEAEVKLNYHDGNTALFVLASPQLPDTVWIESEDDIDLGNELSERYEYAINEGIDELDFYMDLLEIGITVDMVRKYMDDQHADHMEMFCKEHGLI